MVVKVLEKIDVEGGDHMQSHCPEATTMWACLRISPPFIDRLHAQKSF
jgi:hypothetical protein